MEPAYQNQQLNQPVVVGDLLSGRSIATVQAPFLLSEVEYIHLQGSPPLTATLATNLFFAVVGYAISLGPKFIAVIRGEPSQLTGAEWSTLGVGVALAVALYAAGLALPNERRKTMKKIAEHFRNSPASHHLLKGRK